MTPPDPLKIIGASENNLKNISLELAHDELTVVTGLSGSGKSSLAFSTVYAEGQQRYIETFSPYTRQFLDKVKKPAALAIENVRPAIAIQQRTRVMSSRSTVGSMTGINDLLKIVWANLSEPFSPSTSEKLIEFSPLDITEVLTKWQKAVPAGLTVIVAAPLELPDSKKNRKLEIERLTLLGYSRFLNSKTKSPDKMESISNFDDLDPILPVIITRFKSGKIRPIECREALEQAYELARGKATLYFLDAEEKHLKDIPRLHKNAAYFSDAYQPPTYESEDLPFDIPKRKPALFDPNSALGACENCTGFGYVLTVDSNKVVPNQSLSLKDGAIHPWKVSSNTSLMKRLETFAKKQKISLNKPWHQLKPEEQDKVLFHSEPGYSAVIPWFKKLERKRHKMHVRVLLARYRSQVLCTECNGGRLRPEALCFCIEEKNLSEIWSSPVEDVLRWSKDLLKALSKRKEHSSDLTEVLTRLTGRLQYLVDLGLPYVSLGRPTRTLSGGETQRVNLTTALGSDLVSTHFVLDEPSVGLHPRDTERLIGSIRKLQSKGNSLLVVEHDLDCIESSDRVIELGPQAGNLGGEITYNGTLKNWEGVTTRSELPEPRKLPKKFTKLLTIKKANARNLKNITVKLPVGFFTTITGVSGSGKSSFVSEELLPRWKAYSEGREPKNVSGFQHFEDVLLIDQSSLTKSPRANIATYSGVWDTIRTHLGNSEEAERRSLTKSSFSFNVEGGRCPTCKGAGHIKEDMQFLSDEYILCEDCLGERFQEKVLEVTFKDRNVSDWLNTTISELPTILGDDNKIVGVAENLIQLGLGHLRLGHPLSELSGGEAQRLKLIPFLAKAQARSKKADTKGSLLIFDEPTTGLHLLDVRRLVTLLRDLTLKGHTVLTIEHNQELILGSDWIVDLGPEGGSEGGELLTEGSPEDLLNLKRSSSYTSKYLKDYVRAAKKKKNQSSENKKKSSSSSASLEISGAKHHNLKDISLSLPHDAVIAITGVSGSGKSTLAKDIIYAEGQRRYLDCLSPYARQFIRELSKPEVEEIKNIRPTICVHQHTFKPGKLSTIGTMSEVYNFLRLLYSKAGTQFCPYHPDKKVEALSSDLIGDAIRAYKNKTVKILAPIIKGRKGNHKEVFRRALRSEIHEVRVDGQYVPTSSVVEGLERNKQHDIDYVWATVVPARVPQELITDAIDEVFAISGGTVVLATDGGDEVLSRKRACPECRRGFFRPDPEDLSFHSRRGRCEKCEGTGKIKGENCPSCDGTRIKRNGRYVRINGKNISEVTDLTPPELIEFLENLKWDPHLKDLTKSITAELVLRLKVLTRVGLEYLPLSRTCNTLSSGELQRLRLSAALGTPLSGAMYIFDEPSAGLHPDDNERVLGEFHSLKERNNTVLLIEHEEQTIKSAEHIVEIGPGGGSHGGEVIFNGSQRKYSDTSDNEPFNGETVIVGKRGDKNANAREHGDQNVIARERSDRGNLLNLKIKEINNIKSLDLDIPFHRLVTVAGVSGAGKSSLIHNGFLPIVMEACEEGKLQLKNDNAEIILPEEIQRVLVVDQSPIGKNSRSTPASYLKVWDHIRKLFAVTVEARARGWTASFFSYNSGNGRCPECKGLGRTQLEMSFLSEAYVTCEYCRGDRYGDDALSIRYQGKTVADILRMTFEEARDLFTAHKKLHRLLHTACQLGIGYLTLGQSSVTLSGGECQRMKLITELAAPPRGHTLYVLDEPTVGLHRKDVAKLLEVLHSLVALGNTVIVIEHDKDVLEASHHIIEMGPGPGERGGKVIFQGTPKSLSKKKTPWGKRIYQ